MAGDDGGDDDPALCARSGSDAFPFEHSAERRGQPVTGKQTRFRDELVIEIGTPKREPRASRREHDIHSTLSRVAQSPYVSWIATHLNWSSAKPVIRCSVTAWVGLTFLLNNKTDHIMGQVAHYILCLARFFILMGQCGADCVALAFLSPTNLPFAGVVEKEILNIICAAFASAWSALAIKLSALARVEFVDNPAVEDIIDGRYLEVKVTIICGVLLFFGVAIFGYIRSRFGPGPYTVATIVGSLQLITALAYAPLYPYENYQLITLILIPASIHAAVSLTCSLVIFPQSVNAQFIKCLVNALEPVEKALRTQPAVISASPYSSAFDVTTFRSHIQAAEAGITPLSASARLMRRDISYGRFDGDDLKPLHHVARQLLIRAEGMSFFFKLLDPLREKFPETPRGSILDSPIVTPLSSRPPTPVTSPTHSPLIPTAQLPSVRLPPSGLSVSSTVPMSPPSIAPSSKRRKHIGLHLHLPHLKHGLFGEFGHSHENPVGIVESLKYMNLESRFDHPMRNAMLEQSMSLMHDACRDLLVASADSLHTALDWMRNVNAARLQAPWSNYEADRMLSLETLKTSHAQLSSTLEIFRREKRLEVLHPYRSHLSSTSGSPPHRFLFQTFVYQFQLTEFAAVLVQLLADLIALDEHRKLYRIWLPSVPWSAIIRSMSNNWEVTDDTERNEEEDPGRDPVAYFLVPDMIPGIQGGPNLDLGEAHPRNPDAYPPTNVMQEIGALISDGFDALARGNCLYAIKAGFLTLLLILPTYIQASARLGYLNRSVWAAFLGQLNLARFRGDTAYGLVARLSATVFGGLVGIIVWYISAGSGSGNPYGLAATCSVYFPLAFFLLTWGPLSGASNIIFSTTVALVVGISWKDRHSGIQGSPGYGLEVAWRRMVLVAIGLTAAFVFSFLPPSKSIRGYQRLSHATTTLEIGAVYCCIVSLANSRDPLHSDASAIVTRLTALRAKLKRVHAMTVNVKYEVSVHGEWPAERYEVLFQLQMEISALLSQLLSAVQHLEQNWAQAFLHRTRFIDPEFLADVLASLTMISTALRTGRPLPQLTPVLLEQFLRAQQGLGVLQPHADDDFGLPRSVTIETLEDEQYMYFCVGVSSANAIITRIDRLMLATKELVGEHYYIYGLELPLFPRR
ncbi:hypothetical protein EXIGLDRAFT_601614 [Exidia glandulosa HHB12029]|uniref:DUF2421 domain-containing protein n=1 Tax=Exidia glandulosa HHB12029 TaxID=1314781 RepID=A0A165PV95_EXIGL|nr:hypothetical protein EXIGLDRAFT_601614 [Exidia glandulosa HHB12029]